MLTNTAVMRSAGVRAFFVLASSVTVALVLWIHAWPLAGATERLTPIFYDLFVGGDYNGLVCALLILIIAVFVPAHAPMRRLLRTAGEHPLIIAALTTVALSLGSLLVYHNHPLSMDEYAAYFQSLIFASGHINGQLPTAQMDWLIPLGFQDYFLNVGHVTGRVVSAYWPSFSLLLTPFTLAGVPWACNPVLSALTLLVIHRLAMHIFADREAAGIAMLLAGASPVFFGLGISYYSMSAHMLANGMYALLLLRPNGPRVFAAGVVGSVALTLHNPVPHILFCLPWLIWVARRPGGLRLFALLLLGYLPLCLLLGLGWFLFSANLVHEGTAAAAAGGVSDADLRHVQSAFGLPDRTVLLARFVGACKTWAWAVPGLLLLAVVGARRGYANPVCRLLAASALLTFFGYFFVPVDQGHGWGYRYFHSAWLTLPLLATAALYPACETAAKGQLSHGHLVQLFADDPTKVFITTCTLLTLLLGVGVRALEMQRFVANDLNYLPHYRGKEHRVVFLDSRFTFYGADLVQNDPWLRNPEIRMVTHGSEADARLIAANYPAMHLVYEDPYGTVWSTAAALNRSNRRPH